MESVVIGCWKPRFGAAVCIALAVAFPATADDLWGVSALALPYQWTRYYVGVNSGYGWGDRSIGVSGNSTNDALYLASGAVARSIPIDPRGFIGGLQAGYDRQFGQIVLGIEADVAYANIRNSGTATTSGTAKIVDNCCLPLAFRNNYFEYSSSGEQTLRWLGTVRGRMGFLLTDRMLVYGTGGLAYGRASLSAGVNNTGATSDWVVTIDGTVVFTERLAACHDICASGDASRWLVGGTVGGGFEYAFADNWTARIEYLYYNLGTLSVAVIDPRFPTSVLNASAEFTGHVARFSISYRFN